METAVGFKATSRPTSTERASSEASVFALIYATSTADEITHNRKHNQEQSLSTHRRQVTKRDPQATPIHN